MVDAPEPLGSSPLLTSPLHERSVQLGAKYAAFGGWSMPLEFAGAVKEHTAVRTAGGVFDVSHLGKAVVRGRGAAQYVDACLTNDLSKITPGAAQYTVCCNDDGGVVDDLIVYLRSPDEVFLVPNAANAGEVVRRLAVAAPAGVEVVDQHRDYAVVAVQGRRSDDTLAAVGLPVGHAYMSFLEVRWEGSAVTVCRTGYTGERGYELVIPAAAGPSLWDAVLAAGEPYGVVPAGLAARDTLRTEMGYPLHGQDLSPDITPVQARLGWAVGWRKESFWGADALRAERTRGPARTLRGLLSVGRGIPRPGMTVFAEGGDAVVGRVTSGTFSPTLRKGIALALVNTGTGDDGSSVDVDVRGRRERFELHGPPFVKPEMPAA